MSFTPYSTSLRTLDPEDSDDSDLGAFRELIGDTRVVAVGESAHGIREFYRLKDRLFRYLVREHGFTAFVLESGFPEALAVNDWVLGGPGEIEQIAPDAICYSFDVEELRDQFRWMRAWNATHDRKVRFYGLDMAGSGTMPDAGVAACLKRLTPQPGDAELLALSRLGGRFEAAHAYAATPPNDRRRLWAGVEGLKTRAEAAGDEIAYRCARAVEVVGSLLETERHVEGNPRDAFMAETVQWILRREARIMIGAHNAHIIRGDMMGMPMMGGFLAPVLGKEMVVIGTTYAQGKVVRIGNVSDPQNWTMELADLPPPPKGTLDAAMDEVLADLHLVDLNRMPDALVAPAGAMLVQHDAIPFDPRGFDALIHVRHVSPAVGTFENITSEIERGKAAARRYTAP
jgi:erythromycin esterase